MPHFVKGAYAEFCTDLGVRIPDLEWKRRLTGWGDLQSSAYGLVGGGKKGW